MVRIAPPTLNVSRNFEHFVRTVDLLEDSKLGLWKDATPASLGRLGKDTKITLNLMTRSKRVQQSNDRVLSISQL